MRHVVVLSLLLMPVPAFAQVFTPLSGPNDSIASPVCDLINFGFCPQPAPPPPPFTDVEAQAVRPPAPAPVRPMHPHHRRRHLHHSAD